MADTRRHTLSTSYLGAEQAIPADAIDFEVWGVDSDPATAMVAIWFRLTGADGVTVEIPVGADATYGFPAKRYANHTYNIKAAAGTPDACVRIT